MRLVRAVPDAVAVDRLGTELAGLDTLDLPALRQPPRLQRFVGAAWPKLAALAIALVIWQLVVLSGWKPPWLLPAPTTVLGELWSELSAGDLQSAAVVTLRRAALGYGVAIV